MVELAKVRRSLGLTQKEVADSIGMNRAAYTNIENGHRRPSVPVAKRIGEVLKFEWPELYDEKKA